jgi:uncharacterized OB-fold protein
MTTPQYDKPIPEPNALTKPFWEAARNHKLAIQSCKSCGNKQWFPRAWCLECGSRKLEWAEVGGRGTVYSYTIIRQVIGNVPAFQRDIPFVIALVELDEGPRMYSNIVGCKPDDIKIGMKVKVVFDDATETFTLPKFEPYSEP